MRGSFRAAILAGVLGVTACGGGDAEPPRAEPFMVLPPLARVSVRKTIRVEPARPGEFGADETGPVWHRFEHRCSGCHVAPSPAQHTAAEWPRVVGRMSGNMRSAGLLPLAERDSLDIVDLLRRYAPAGAPVNGRSDGGISPGARGRGRRTGQRPGR